MPTDSATSLFSANLSERVFACAPGQDFPRTLVDGFVARTKGRPPEHIAGITIYLNTRRMMRRVDELFQKSDIGLMPRLQLVTDLADEIVAPPVGPAVADMQRMLELRQLVARLIELTPEIAPMSAVTDLADSLVKLLDEFSDAGLSPDVLGKLDVRDESGHWQQSLKFLKIIQPFCTAGGTNSYGAVARFRKVAERLVEHWHARPTTDPIIIAGSTGSRGTTSLLMNAVAHLPQGVLVLPGFDFEQPEKVWDALSYPEPVEDHPQYRFAKLMDELAIQPHDIRHWHDLPSANSIARNRLISLALRPAPVTDQWLQEAPALKNVRDATKGVAILEAPNSDVEATAIALTMRNAIELGKSIALVTPDQDLTRSVSAKLDRWQVVPDASLGTDLSQSPPGRLLRACMYLGANEVDSALFLSILKHPLAGKGGDRNLHMLQTRGLEIWLRKRGIPFVNNATLDKWLKACPELASPDWVAWVQTLVSRNAPEKSSLLIHLNWHVDSAESIVSGHLETGIPDELWEKDAGMAAKEFFSLLRNNAESAGNLTFAEYHEIFDRSLSDQEVREPIQPRSDVLIWGPMEARAQGADIVILGGLNEGTWPEAPAPDPWLNRRMRKDAGLLLPERRIGLSAHDFQQAIGAKQVIVARALRDADADTVPSRWVNRLTNLLTGMGQEGKEALDIMRRQGARWVDMAQTLDASSNAEPSAPRPAPAPPAITRPRSLSVTDIRNLIRDPYAVYARKVLGIDRLGPFTSSPDARMRGILLHSIMEKAPDIFKESGDVEQHTAKLLGVAENVFESSVPWAEIRSLWHGKFEKIARSLTTDEILRREGVVETFSEKQGILKVDGLNLQVTAKADRIDRQTDGTLAIYDYKSSVPAPKDLREYEKQLFIEAVIATYGSFENIQNSDVSKIGYIGLGASANTMDIALDSGGIEESRNELRTLLTQFARADQGYSSRRLMKSEHAGDYDHMARFGEWDEADVPVLQVLT